MTQPSQPPSPEWKSSLPHVGQRVSLPSSMFSRHQRERRLAEHVRPILIQPGSSARTSVLLERVAVDPPERRLRRLAREALLPVTLLVALRLVADLEQADVARRRRSDHAEVHASGREQARSGSGGEQRGRDDQRRDFSAAHSTTSLLATTSRPRVRHMSTSALTAGTDMFVSSEARPVSMSNTSTATRALFGHLFTHSAASSWASPFTSSLVMGTS